MISKINIRVWLTHNKIFFETITAILLAIMALIVSYQANKIASYQVSLTKLENLPVFRFEIAQQINGHESLTIYNDRSQLSEFGSTTYIFMKIDYGKVGKDLVIAKVPLIEYYLFHVNMNQTTGALTKFMGFVDTPGNTQKTIELEREFAEWAKEMDSFGFVSVERYVKVQYRDIWGEFHEEVFFVDPLRARKLSESQKKEVIEDYDNKMNKQMFIKLSRASRELLYEKWAIVNNHVCIK